MPGYPALVVVALGLVAAVALFAKRDLIALLAALVVANLPYLVAPVWDSRDTNSHYHLFHVFYEELFFDHRLALWFPFGTFGQANEYLSGFHLNAVDQLVMVLGRLGGMRDTWRLFALSSLGQEVAFLFGLFLLSRRFFARRSTVLLVGLTTIGSMAWYWHDFFSLRMVSLLPLMLFFLFRFFEERRPEFFWLAGFTGVIAAQGSAFLSLLWGFVLLIVLAVMTVKYAAAWPSLLSRSRSNWGPMVLFVVAAAAYFYVAFDSLGHFVFTKNDRDPVTGKVMLETFLHHGGNPTADAILRVVLSGPNSTNDWDNGTYFGLLPLCLFGFALLRERSARFWALASAGLAVLWLMFGGAFAGLIYRLPMMAYVRWLAWLGPLVKMFVIVCAGFGWERFWSSRRRFAIGVAFAVALLFARDAVALAPGLVSSRLVTYAMLVTLGIAVTALLRWRGGARTRDDLTSPLVVALLVGLILDLGAHQRSVAALLPRFVSPDARTARLHTVEPLTYQERRTAAPPTPRGQYGLTQTRITYPTSTYGFLHWDPCRIASPADYFLVLPEGTQRLFKAMRPEDPRFQALIGCTTPKLRLVSHAVIARDAAHAAELLAGTADLDQTVVLRPEPGTAELPAAPAAPVSNAPVSVTAFSANDLTAAVNVASEPGTWLLYADGIHPGWHATVDGAPARIVEADLAFKAVWVPTGSHVVRFWFWDGLNSVLVNLLGLASIASGLVLAVWLARAAASPC